MNLLTASIAASTLAICPLMAQETELSHASIAQEIIALLSDTELVLNSCRDQESVAAAIPELRELAARARDIRTRQLTLPDSSLQEDISIARSVPDFRTLWDAVSAHIERLQNENLMSDELREVLCIAPTTR